MKKHEKLIAPLIAIVLGILLGTLIIIISGRSPILMFSSLIRSLTGIDLSRPGPINLRYFGEFIVTSMPIILSGLAIGFAYRTGLFNIGCEGQVMIGGAFAAVAGILLKLPPVVHAVACLLAGGLAGALWAFLPGLLKVKKNISEVVTGIMLNYVALYIGNICIKALPNSTLDKTAPLPKGALLSSSLLSGLTRNSRLNWGILVVILAVFAYWLIIEKTTFGYSLRATGFNKDGAKYAGMNVSKNVISAIMISGFLAGLAGAVMTLGTFGFGRVLSAAEGYGFDGIAVALVGGCNAIGILLSGLLFGLLKVAQPALQSMSVPKDIAVIISSAIIMFVAMQNGIMGVIYSLTDKFHKERSVSK